MKINKLIEKFDVIRSSHRRSSYYYDSEDGSTGDSSRSKLWRFTTSYRETLSPTFSDNSMLFRRDRLLSCVKFTPAKKTKNLVTVLVGKERQAFQVEPQILDHGVVQGLVEKSMENRGESLHDEYFSRLRAGESPLFEENILLDCDAILFEHILWLLSNDDPSLRNLNVDELHELMEFYT